MSDTVEVVIRIDKNTFDAAGMLQEFVDDGHISEKSMVLWIKTSIRDYRQVQRK